MPEKIYGEKEIRNAIEITEKLVYGALAEALKKNFADVAIRNMICKIVEPALTSYKEALIDILKLND